MKKGYHKMPDGTMMKDSAMGKSSGYNHGGMAKKTMGYAKGGMVNCGASMKPTQKSK
jgi:hypothetical protein